MSFGSLSEEAKVALSRGAERAGTGICSGEGGMLPEEQQANSRYFYELASAKFGYDEALLERVQAFHFKGGQGAKTGTGGHLPAVKNFGKISEVRGLEPGTAAVSPATFTDLTGGLPDDSPARQILHGSMSEGEFVGSVSNARGTRTVTTSATHGACGGIANAASRHHPPSPLPSASDEASTDDTTGIVSNSTRSLQERNHSAKSCSFSQSIS